MMYLAGNTWLDIAYVVHQTARFTHSARNLHLSGVTWPWCSGVRKINHNVVVSK
jgi:hypothetical protein